MKKSYENLYETITTALVEQGYIVIDDALESLVCAELMQHAMKLQGYKHAGISSSANLQVNKQRRRDKIHWLDENHPTEKKFLTFSEGLRVYLNRHLFLGLSYYEAHFAKYEAGDFYEKHLDAFQHSKNRVVTTVYYLNEGWSKEDGGEIVLYDEKDNQLQTLLPTANRLVVFLSEKFPHEVQPANTTRHSIAGWFRVDKR
jgi:SM-20-related protein